MPPTFPEGLDCSLISSEALNRVDKNKLSDHDLEHVTSYFKRNKQFSVFNVVSKSKIYSNFKLSVDILQDYLLVKKLISSLGFNCNYKSIKKFINKNKNFFQENLLFNRNYGDKLNLNQKKWINSMQQIEYQELLLTKLLKEKSRILNSKNKLVFLHKDKKKNSLIKKLNLNILNECKNREKNINSIQILERKQKSLLSSIKLHTNKKLWRESRNLIVILKKNIEKACVNHKIRASVVVLNSVVKINFKYKNKFFYKKYFIQEMLKKDIPFSTSIFIYLSLSKNKIDQYVLNLNKIFKNMRYMIENKIKIESQI